MASEPRLHVARFGEFELDLRSGELSKGSVRTVLPHQPFRLLAMLVERRGGLVTRDELRRELWPDNTYVDFEHSLNAAIRRVRESLGDHAETPRFIETLPRRGYRFIAQVSDQAVEARAGQDDVPTPRPATPHRWPLVVAIVLTLAALGPGVAWLLRSVPHGHTAESATRVARVTNLGTVRLASLAPDGRALAYVRAEGAAESLWLRRAPLSDIEVVGPIDGFFRSVTFGPDERLYYTAFVSNRTDVSLYRVSTAGGLPERLLDAAAGVSFSPDGSRMAYVSTVSFSVHESRLVLASRDGALPRVIAIRTPPLSFANAKPAWSPDGAAVAAIVVNEQTPLSVDLLTVDATNGQPRGQIRLEMASVSGLAWLADGTRVLSGRSRQALPVRLWSLSPGSSMSRPLTEDVSDYELVGISSDGTNAVAVRRETARTLWASDVTNLTNARQIAVESGSIAGFEGIAWAGNREVLYPAVEAGNVDIFAVDLSSGVRRRVTSDPSDDFHPSVSADGRWVAFATDRSGRSSTWIMEIDGSHPRRLTQGVDSRPALSPDARWVVVQRNGIASAPSTMWRVAVDTGQSVRLGALQAYRPSVSPDGKYVAHYWMTPEQWTLAVTPAAGGLPVRTLPIRSTHLERVVRWSPDGKGLAFIDAVDGAGNIWLQPLDGNATARPLTHMTGGRMTTFDWSRDGSRLAWTTVTEISDVVTVACCPR